MITSLLLGFALHSSTSGRLSEVPKLAQWSLAAYGAKPTVQLESRVMHSASPSIEISSEAPSDAALGQNIEVEPGAVYQFSAWIKTRQLRPLGGPVFGTIVAQSNGGATNLGTGQNHSGDTDWTRERVTFTAPSDGRVHLALFLSGWGKGTGSVWFSSIQLNKIDFRNSPMKITDEPLGNARINPMQYGQFIEYLCDLVPSMWAEKLYDPSFEGLSPYKFVYLKETDFKEKPWYPYGQTNRFAVSQDKTTFMSGSMSKRVDLTGASPCEGGVAQDGISINKDIPCHFSIYARGSRAAQLRVKLFHGSKLYASADLPIGTRWNKVQATLSPAATDPNTTISLSFEGAGTY